MFNFEKLEVYNKAIEFVKMIYMITQKFPKEEQFGIISQLRRASVSISSNIAEGSGRFHKKDFQQFLRIARSSAYECVTLLQISKELAYLSTNDFDKLYCFIGEITKMISGLINSLNKQE